MDKIKSRFVDQTYGIECGEGWNSIISHLDSKISEIDPEYRILQVKEKFGLLKVYLADNSYLSDDDREQIYFLLQAAEIKSKTTCEKCGDAGEEGLSNSGWWGVLCRPCAPSGWKNYREEAKKYGIQDV